MTDIKSLHVLLRPGVTMERLHRLADDLREAHAAQALAESHVGIAQIRQHEIRQSIIGLLGQDDGQAFIDLLRDQSGFLASKPWHRVR